jgi:hypothetical protein
MHASLLLLAEHCCACKPLTWTYTLHPTPYTLMDVGIQAAALFTATIRRGDGSPIALSRYAFNSSTNPLNGDRQTDNSIHSTKGVLRRRGRPQLEVHGGFRMWGFECRVEGGGFWIQGVVWMLMGEGFVGASRPGLNHTHTYTHRCT